MVDMNQARPAAYRRGEGGLEGEVRPGWGGQVKVAVAEAEGEVGAGEARLLDVTGRGERRPVPLRRHRRHHDRGVDAVGEDDDGDADGRLPADGIGVHLPSDRDGTRGVWGKGGAGR